jgi:hypothetical protein
MSAGTKDTEPDLRDLKRRYDEILARRAALRDELDPTNVGVNRGERVKEIAEAYLDGKDAPQGVYRPRAYAELLFDGATHAITSLVRTIGDAVAIENGREGYSDQDFQIAPAVRPLPADADALVAALENGCELATRRDQDTDRRADQLARQEAAVGEFNRLSFEYEQQGHESSEASEKARAAMKLPVADLHALEGQVRMPTQYGG